MLFKEFINYSGGYRCYECNMSVNYSPLAIEHKKNCTTPKRIKLYQTKEFQKMLELIELKGKLLKQIKNLEKEKLKLLRQVGVLNNDPKWIDDYIEALAKLSRYSI